MMTMAVSIEYNTGIPLGVASGMNLNLETRQYSFFSTSNNMSLKADELTECHGIDNLTIHDSDSKELCSDKKIQLTPSDVIFGRGKKSNNHKGNVRFHLLVNEQLGAYMAACDGPAKINIANDIVNQVLVQNGRFLRWADGAWSIADNDSIIQKVTKTLRNKIDSNRRLQQEPHCVDSVAVSHELTSQSKYGSAIFETEAFSSQELTISVLGALTGLLKSICKDSALSSTLKTEILKSVLWTFAFASDGDEACIQAVMSTSDCLDNLITIIRESKNTNIVIPALVTVGNFVTGNSHQVQEVINAGFLDIAEYLLKSETQGIRVKVSNILSKISSVTQAQIDTLINQNNIIVLLVKYTAKEYLEIRTEAIWTVANLFIHGSDLHVQYLVQADGLTAMCDVLGGSGNSEITMALAAIENILTVGEQLSLNYTIAMHDCGGIDKLEMVQEHVDDVIHEKALHIIETFFGEDEIEG